MLLIKFNMWTIKLKCFTLPASPVEFSPPFKIIKVIYLNNDKINYYFQKRKNKCCNVVYAIIINNCTE